MTATASAILSQLQPFNDARFDACMAYLAQTHAVNRLTLYDLVKLHVMTDVLHTVKHGRPVIGGSLSAWKNGPVVPEAYNRLRHWAYKYEEDGFQPENFDIVERRNSKIYFTPTMPVDADDFSASETSVMALAWTVVMQRHKDWGRSQVYFHEPISPIGEAWKKAWDRQSPIDWRDVVDAFARHGQVDLSDIKAIIST